jgi:hypothetical protein
MNHKVIIDRLEAGPQVLDSLVSGMMPEQVRWKRAPGKWSVLEVICHLFDEEWEDFRPRVMGPLDKPDFVPTALGDPEKRAMERQYNSLDIEKSVRGYKEERAKSVECLRSLDKPNWKSGFEIPGGGKMFLTAESVLAAWLGHDNLHFRQILTIQWNYLSKDIEPLTLEYVGRL